MQGAKKFVDSDRGKDLLVNVGGIAGSTAGGAVGGLPGALTGDNLGAAATRRGLSEVYARRRARAKLGANASPSAFLARKDKIFDAIHRLERRKGARMSDQVGWAVGNTIALNTPHLKIPLRGGIVAMRTVPHIVKNAQGVLRGNIKARDFPSKTGADIYKSNNLRRIVRRGNARERLLRSKVNKRIRGGTFSMYLMRRRIATFYRHYGNATRQNANNLALFEYSHRQDRYRLPRQWGEQYTRLPSRAEFYLGRGLTRYAWL